MNRRVVVFIIIFICVMFALSIRAEDSIITVTFPKPMVEMTDPVNLLDNSMISTAKLRPVSVTEYIADDRRSIVKTYELSPDDRLSDISIESFDFAGWHYELSDITEKSNVRAEQKSYAETVTIDSETNDFDAILVLLPTSKDYNIDNFTGTLMLDANSIIIEQAGTTNVAYTISADCEYSNLPVNDTSVLPATIEQDGQALALSKVTWTQSSSVAEYTAVATYTATLYKTVAVSYNVTAQYSGIIVKKVTDTITYITLFTGVRMNPSATQPTPTYEIVTEPTTMMMIIPTETEPTLTAAVTTEIIPTISMIVEVSTPETTINSADFATIEMTQITEILEVTTENDEKSTNVLSWLSDSTLRYVVAGVGLFIVCIIFFCIKRRKKKKRK